MKTPSRFVAEFTSLIVAVLSCFDRVIFNGHLPITNALALLDFVDHVLKIRRCDVIAFAERQSAALVDRAKNAKTRRTSTTARCGLIVGPRRRSSARYPQADWMRMTGIAVFGVGGSTTS